MIKTGITHPLRIDAVATPGGGQIGMTFCPGKKQRDSISGAWSRDLGLDLDRIREWGAITVVTLMEAHELACYKVGGLGDAVRQRGMTWSMSACRKNPSKRDGALLDRTCGPASPPGARFCCTAAAASAAPGRSPRNC